MRFFDFGKHHLDGESWKLGDRNLAEVPNLAAEWKVIHQFQTRNYPIGDFPGPLPLGLWVRLDARDNTYYSTSYDLAFPNEGLQLWNGGDMLGEINHLPPAGEWTRIDMTHEKVEDHYFISVSMEGVGVIRHKVELDPEYVGFPAGTLFDATVGFGNHEDQLPASIGNLIVLEK